MGFIAKRSNEFHWGLWFAGKAQWIVNVALLAGVYDIPKWIIPVLMITITMGIWFIGYLVERTKLRERIQNEHFKGVRISQK